MRSKRQSQLRMVVLEVPASEAKQQAPSKNPAEGDDGDVHEKLFSELIGPHAYDDDRDKDNTDGRAVFADHKRGERRVLGDAYREQAQLEREMTSARLAGDIGKQREYYEEYGVLLRVDEDAILLGTVRDGRGPNPGEFDAGDGPPAGGAECKNVDLNRLSEKFKKKYSPGELGKLVEIWRDEATLECQMRSLRTKGAIGQLRTAYEQYGRLLRAAEDITLVAENRPFQGETKKTALRRGKRRLGPAPAPAQPAPAPAQPAPEKRPKRAPLADLMAKASELMRRGLAPLHTFVGMVNVRAGLGGDVRYSYRWIEGKEGGGSLEERSNPVDTTAATLEEFVERNRHLGANFLDLFIQLYGEYEAVATMIGDCIDIDNPRDLTQESVIRLIGADEYVYAPLWVWGVVGDATFRSILSASTLSAFDMALSQVRRVPGASTFTLKELICSEGVRDKFAFFVAYNFMFPNAGVNPNDGGGGSRSSRVHRWVNVERMRRELSQSMLGAQIWFEDVYRGGNALYAAFKAKTEALVAEENPAEAALHERLLRQMPKHALFHAN